MRFKRILCAVNDGPSSDAAVALAIDLARDGASVILCRVVERDRVAAAVGDVPGAALIVNDAVASSERGLEHLRQRVAERVPDTLAVTLDAPSVWRALAAEAERRQVDLVVVGAGARRHGVIGATAQRVVRHTSCAVLVASGAPRKLAKVVCAVDFSRPSRQAMQVAAELAAGRGAELTFVHAVSRPDDPAPAAEAASAAGTLGACVAEVVPGARAAARIAVVEGRPAAAIAETALAGDYDLVVAGSHGRTGIERLLLGSVAEEIVRRADRPVLIVRGDGAAREAARHAPRAELAPA